MRSESGSFRCFPCFGFLILAFVIFTPPSNAAPELTWSTYLDGSGLDRVGGLTLDQEDNIYLEPSPPTIGAKDDTA